MRDHSLDTLRGFAVLLMVVDHVLIVAGVAIVPDGLGWVRATITRLSCPLFFIVAGALWARREPGLVRLVCVGLLGVVFTFAISFLVYPTIDILLQYAMLALFARIVVGWPLVVAVLGAVQSRWLPLSVGGSYEWGYLALFASLGVLARHRLTIPHFKVIAAVGRWPLAVYVLHWLFLFACLGAVVFVRS